MQPWAFAHLDHCAMAARPPPARPHIGLNPSPRFASYSTADWVEDDAWDSASDEETPSTSGWGRGMKSSSPATSPKPVPKPQNNSSSSTLASSFTHLHAPSPSSYPPRPEAQQLTSKNGWTIVRKGNESLGTPDQDGPAKLHESQGDVEVEGDMILGEMDPDVVEHPSTSPPKQRHNQGSIREDASEIVNGTHSTYVICFFNPHIPARSIFSCSSFREESSVLCEGDNSTRFFGES